MATTALPTWQNIIAVEPQLAELAYRVAGSSPPTSEPGYGQCWLALLADVERLATPLGNEAFAVARDHLHRVFTDAVLRESLR